jgi:hypothetical protein
VVGEDPEVVAVVVAEWVAETVTQLQLRGQAANLPPVNRSDRREAFPGVCGPCIGAERLPPVPDLVKDDRVKVDLVSAVRAQHYPGRKARLRPSVVNQPERLESPLNERAIRPGDDEVEICVRSGLRPDERIDSPPTADPELDPR